jgi:hypothetical protein
MMAKESGARRATIEIRGPFSFPIVLVLDPRHRVGVGVRLENCRHLALSFQPSFAPLAILRLSILT